MDIANLKITSARFKHTNFEEVQDSIRERCSVAFPTAGHLSNGLSFDNYPKTEEDILWEIIEAQISSDGGKGNARFASFDENTWREGYDNKDQHILNAILGILATNTEDIRWFISSDFDLYEYEQVWAERGGKVHRDTIREMRSILYFEWKGFQISFHSFSPVWKDLCDQVSNFSDTVWDRKSSAVTCAWMLLSLPETDIHERIYLRSEIISKR